MNNNAVLIVDDSVLNLELAKDVLTLENMDVKTAQSAEEALDILKDFSPKVILMDLQMPNMDGLTLTKKLRNDNKYKDTVIIALTALAMKNDKEKALAAGCDDYISKPFDIDELSNKVKKCLG